MSLMSTLQQKLTYRSLFLLSSTSESTTYFAQGCRNIICAHDEPVSWIFGHISKHFDGLFFNRGAK